MTIETKEAMNAFSEIRYFITLTCTFPFVSPSERRCTLSTEKLLWVCYRLVLSAVELLVT